MGFLTPRPSCSRAAWRSSSILLRRAIRLANKTASHLHVRSLPSSGRTNANTASPRYVAVLTEEGLCSPSGKQAVPLEEQGIARQNANIRKQRRPLDHYSGSESRRVPERRRESQHQSGTGDSPQRGPREGSEISHALHPAQNGPCPELLPSAIRWICILISCLISNARTATWASDTVVNAQRAKETMP